MKRILRNAELIYWLVKKLEEKYPNRQIGKTKIQKLMYLLEEELNEDFEYTMYHYGPYSSEIAESLSTANMAGWLDLKWHIDKGYFISAKDISLPFSIKDKEREIIEKIIDKYGDFSAVELSIIATAVYVRKNFEVGDSDEIIDIVLSLKPNNQRAWIKNLLKKAGVIE